MIYILFIQSSLSILLQAIICFVSQSNIHYSFVQSYYCLSIHLFICPFICSACPPICPFIYETMLTFINIIQYIIIISTKYLVSFFTFNLFLSNIYSYMLITTNLLITLIKRYQLVWYFKIW